MKYQDAINSLYFEHEGRKYMKQFLAMYIYSRSLKSWKQNKSNAIYDEPRPTLKEAWEEVKYYFSECENEYFYRTTSKDASFLFEKKKELIAKNR